MVQAVHVRMMFCHHIWPLVRSERNLHVPMKKGPGQLPSAFFTTNYFTVHNAECFSMLLSAIMLVYVLHRLSFVVGGSSEAFVCKP